MEKASGFLLSALSPVWRVKLCWPGDKSRGNLVLEEGEAPAFRMLLALGCGEPVVFDGGVKELVSLGRMADRYQVEVVQCAVEDAVLCYYLTVESCGIILEACLGSGMERLTRASWKLALQEFDEFSKTAGFLGLSEEALGSLLDDDGLTTEKEEVVFEGVVRWMKGGGDGGIRGRTLLQKIRFPYMDVLFLANVAIKQLPNDVGLEILVHEAGLLKSLPPHMWAGRELLYLDARALVQRGRVRWENYLAGGQQRLPAGTFVYSVAAHGGYVCGGRHDGSIRVWNRSTLQRERNLTGHTDAVWVMLSAWGRLISGSCDHTIRVWQLAAGQCEGVLVGHTNRVTALVASGSRLLSCSCDKTVRVWRTKGDVSEWWCEQELNAGSAVHSLAAFEGKVAGGKKDGCICVWKNESESGMLEQLETLRGHSDRVAALVVSGLRLISSSFDKTIKVWSLGTWACMQTLEAYPSTSEKFILRLAVNGSTLVGGSSGSCSSRSQKHEVRVWDLETLQPLHTLKRLASKHDVFSLFSDGGEVWGAVGQRVMVWGRRG